MSTIFAERDDKVFAALQTHTLRVVNLAWDTKLSEGQVVASLKRLKAQGRAERTFSGWRRHLCLTTYCYPVCRFKAVR